MDNKTNKDTNNNNNNNISFDLNNDYMDEDEEIIGYNQTNDELHEELENLQKKLRRTKTTVEQIKSLESLLMDDNLERNLTQIIHLIDEISSYELCNYRIEETESNFLHLTVNRQKSLHHETSILQIFEKLIENNCDVNCVDSYGWSILHYCCSFNLIRIVTFLFQKNFIKSSTVNLKSIKQVKIGKHYFISGTTPLQVCAWCNHLEMAELLVKNLASIHDKNDCGWNSLHICAHQAHLEFSKYLIRLGININECNDHLKTALHISSRHGHKELAKTLLDSNANISMKNCYGETSLYVAVKRGHINIVRLLIKYQADPNQVDNQENNPLHVCALLPEIKDLPELKNESSTSRYISIDKSTNNIKINNNNNTNNNNRKYHDGGDDDAEEKYTTQWKNVEIAKLLLASGCNLLKRNNLGCTPLHYCAKNNCEQLSALLISKSHSLINIRDFYGQTALYFACKWKSLECEKLLLKKNANKDMSDMSGLTPIHLCASKSYEELLSVLLEFGDDINKVTTKNNKDTSLHIAVSKNNYKIANFLIKNHADMNKQNRDGQTALHLASLNGSVESCQILLSNGAKVNKQDTKGKTPLHSSIQASTLNSIKIAKMLVDFGALINQEDLMHRTPLAQSTIEGNYNLVKFLVSKKAKIMNSNYESVIHLCALNDKCDADCLKLLIDVYGVNALFNYSLTNYCTPLQLCVELRAFNFLRSLIACDSMSCLDWFERLHSTKGLGVSPLVMAITSQNFEFLQELIALWNRKFNESHHYDLKLEKENTFCVVHGCEKCHSKDLCLFKPNWNDPEQNSEKYYLNILIRENTQLTKQILDTFIKTDILKWKTYVYLDHLEPCENIIEENISKFQRPLTPLETIYIYDKTSLVNHPVVQALLIEKYNDFAKSYFWIDGIHSICLLIVWTLFTIYENYSLRHYYNGPNSAKKIIIIFLVVIFFLWDVISEFIQIYYVYKRILGFKSYIKSKFDNLKNSEKYEDKSKESIVNHIKANEERFELEQYNNTIEDQDEDEKKLKKIIKDDCFIINSSKTNKYSLVEKEARAAESIPMPYHNYDNLIDWITCSFQLFSILTHLIDYASHSDVIARINGAFIYITLILVWLRQLLTVNGIFPGVRLVCMIRLIGSSICSYGLLYCRIYVPFALLFWALYSGTHVQESVMINYWQECEYLQFNISTKDLNKTLVQNLTNLCKPNITVKGFENFYSSLYSVFQMIIVDTYDFESMKKIHGELAPFICAIFIIISSIIGLNFFIGLMTNVLTDGAYQLVEAHESMELLGYVLEHEWRLSKLRRQQHLNRIRKECAPRILTGKKVILLESSTNTTTKKATTMNESTNKRENIIKNDIYSNKKISNDLNNNLVEMANSINSLKNDLNEIKDIIRNNLSILHGAHDSAL